MLKRYSIWDKQSDVVCPSGEVFTAAEWMERYPVAKMEGVTIVGGKGIINGSIFGVLQQMVIDFENRGYDFSECVTDEEKLEMIEAIEDSYEPSPENRQSTPEERIAAALEALEMNSLPTVNDDDPDEE